MGGDGGVIANQRAFVRGIGKDPSDGANKEGKNVAREQRVRATTCALTNQRFTEPLVCCELGNIYNKEVVLQGLLDKSLQEIFPHIRGLKDLKTLKITKNPAIHEASDVSLPYIVCPITKLEMNGLIPFVVIWSTGFVLSEKAVKEVGINDLQDENGPFNEKDIVKLLPLEAEQDDCRAAMFHRRAAQDAKKAAKQAKKKSAEPKESAEGDLIDEEIDDGAKKGKKRKSDSIEDPVSELAANTSSQTAPTKKSSSERLVTSAMNAVKENEEKSAVYKSLFHKTNEKDRKDRDLFMTVAGLRYTLGSGEEQYQMKHVTSTCI